LKDQILEISTLLWGDMKELGSEEDVTILMKDERVDL
jgi:hypothetical protein